MDLVDVMKKSAVFSVMLLFAMIQCDASMGKQNGIDAEKTLPNDKTIPLKSVKSPDGDIIDCIDIYQQLAFDHPSLKNHTIQMRPSYYPEGTSGGNTQTITQLWQTKGSCPQGTIPVRRTNKEELLRPNYGKKQPGRFSQFSPNADPFNGHEHAIAYVENNKYHGAKAVLNVWQPQVQNPGEFSLAQIWVTGGPFSNLNSVEAGWQVAPSMYGDNSTRLFAYWTSDGYKSHGCYNTICPGFVQTSSRILVGGSITPLSTYHGPQYDVTIIIWKDPSQNSWWMSYQNETIGYWPGSLFTHLADSASGIQWGGEVYDSKPNGQHTTTPMGSGHFAEEGFKGASFFRSLYFFDESNHLVFPGDDLLEIRVEQPNCYNLSTYIDDVFGYSFYFGGPGRNPSCP